MVLLRWKAVWWGEGDTRVQCHLTQVAIRVAREREETGSRSVGAPGSGFSRLVFGAESKR
jgi:hypothetical protein